jgi:hypothetical protein
MEILPTEIWNLSDIAIVAVFGFWSFSIIIKAILNRKKNGNGNTQSDLLDKVKLIESNHLNDILKAIGDGNDKIVEAINENGKQQIQILGEIKGAISQMK